MTSQGSRSDDRWPELPWEAWKDTAQTLHMWTQIVGKLRLAHTPWTNHSWHVTLYVTPRGLTTSTIPHPERSFQVDFDFVAHRLILVTSDGETRELPLEAQTTAEFHARVVRALRELRLPTAFHGRPNEVDPAIPFAEDRVHAAYDPAAAQRFWRVLVQVARVFKAFRARFVGKCSPVHFFWGSFDLAVTRFSGRPAPPHPGGFPNLPDRVTREAYSHEVSSAGFWPGGPSLPRPIFFSYAYPAPPGFAEVAVRPAEAAWSTELGEFVLDYDAVRRSVSPEAALTSFLESTYEGAARLAGWDLEGLRHRFDP